MHEFKFLIIIWLGVYLSSFLAKKTNMTPVLYFLGFGCLSVNVGILPKNSSNFIHVFAELGIILVMFSMGLSENSSKFVKSIKNSFWIAFWGALIPFLSTYSFFYLIWKDFKIATISGLAMTATAVSLTMVSLKNEKLESGKASTAIMASAIIDDIASLALIAIIVPILTNGEQLSIESLILIISKIITFFIIIVALGTGIFPKDKRKSIFRNIPILKKFNIHDFIIYENGSKSTLAVLLVVLLIGSIASIFGFHPAIGAYLAGLILRKEYFIIQNNEFHFEKIKNVIDDAAFTWIGPVFFIQLGSKLVYQNDIFATVILYSILLFILLYLSQIVSASMAARLSSNHSFQNSILIGIGMVGRAELAFVVLDIGFTQHQILSREIFYTLMITCFFLNLSVPISIKLWKSKFSN